MGQYFCKLSSVVALFTALILACTLPNLSLGEASYEEENVVPKSNLEIYLDIERLKVIFPSADSFGPAEGSPPSVTVYKDQDIIGYAFETHDVVQGVGFSKRPFHILVGLNLDGILEGVRLTHHAEPIAILGRTDDDFHNYLEQFPGLDIRKGVNVVIAMSGSVLDSKKFSQRTTSKNTGDVIEVDAVSRTTTSSVVFSDSIIRSARLIARNRGLSLESHSAGHVLDVDRYQPMTWPELVEDGSLSRLSLTHGDIGRAFAEKNIAPPSTFRSWKEEEVFMEFYMALVTPAGIGINLLDQVWYDQYRAGRSIGDIMLLMLSSGNYSLTENNYNEDGIFTGIQLIQGDTTISLRADQFKELPFIHAKQRPEFNNISLFFLTPDVSLDPTQPWRAELLVTGNSPNSHEAEGVVFGIPYHIPKRFLISAPSLPATSNIGGSTASNIDSGINWKPIWLNQMPNITLLAFTLVTLTMILTFQSFISRRPFLHRWIRIGFLSWILIWLGWYAGAQVTIIHILNVVQSLPWNFDLGFFLTEPLIFIISVYVLFAVFLWGRAIFCGWLCPFGALQELLFKVGQLLKIRPVVLPNILQRWLAKVKYLVFLALVGLTFYSFDLAISGTQIEPFKTAITFRFDAPWPALLYVILLLALGLFVERFYCRFICPLGGGLAFLGKLRLFNWLKRRAECGNPCMQCETVCPVGAINKNGHIDMNECFYCLDCQVVYYDDHQCPPLIALRKRRERLS
jgi:NosR/NirI family nitrous oxide reductase transcriptional regulator